MPILKQKYEKDRSINFTPDHGSTAGMGEGDIIWHGENEVAAGRIYYLDDAEEGALGAWYAADADILAASTNLLAVALGSGVASNVGMLLRGTVTLGVNPGDGAGNVLYLSTTATTCSRAAPTSSGDFIRVVGYTIANGGHIFFNPGSTVVKIA